MRHERRRELKHELSVSAVITASSCLPRASSKNFLTWSCDYQRAMHVCRMILMGELRIFRHELYLQRNKLLHRTISVKSITQLSHDLVLLLWLKSEKIIE